MNGKFYLLKNKKNTSSHPNFLARMLGSGASSKEPYYLTSIADFGIRCCTLFDLYEVIVELNLTSTRISPSDFEPVLYEMSNEQQSFSNPKLISFENFLPKNQAERIMRLDVDLLDEEQKIKFLNKYGD